LCKPEHKPKGTKYHCIFEILSERAEEAEHFDGTDCYETQFLCYSSGTTGLPKGVMTTHNNMVSQMCTSHICLDPMSSETDALLGFLPMSHAFGLMAILLQPLTQGVPAVILPRFDELKALAAIEKVS
jgi:acyl-CoA synthetase (AMP-forming)/AMP-acid ligase II